MSDAYTVDLERLDAVVQRIQTFDASVERRLADLNHRMAHIRTIWTGDASQAQAAAHDEWTAAAASSGTGSPRCAARRRPRTRTTRRRRPRT